jgi:hypothetical protein
MKSRISYRSQSGIALVITLILLAVITFMAVTFLVISNSQKAAAGTAQQQTVARNAEAAARERFTADIVSRIIATRNPDNLGLFVSTNFYNAFGFTNGVVSPLNVNFDYDTSRAPLGANDQELNLINLLYDPRVPVYVTNRAAANSEDFRYYLDVNRNGRFDVTGLIAERDVNGLLIPSTNGFRTNHIVGDPQWIGILERPEFPHSPSNRFIARFCYFAVPIGNALDVNYIHNQAYNPAIGKVMNVSGGDFFRNQGVGPWEINLAAFFTDLNSNAWPGTVASYNYTPLTPAPRPASGTTFEDAFQVYRHRLNGLNYNLASVFNNYGAVGAQDFQNDRRDGYTGAALPVQNTTGLIADPDLANNPWPGSENPNHIYNHQDWFDRSRLGRVADKLNWLATSNSTYDSTTFLRLQEQLGTDSVPESGKLNLNYVNIGGLRETNFVSWHDPDLRAGNPARGIPAFGAPGHLLFFTNAADRILRKQFNFGVTDIPVWSNGVSYYSPAVHRGLQLAANLYEASTNSRFPLVFRPLFTKDASGLLKISRFEEVSADTAPLAAQDISTALTETTGSELNRNYYGVPWIIGAKKGFPSLNEIGLATRAEVTRKLLITRPPNARSPGAGWTTNLQYSVALSNSIALEAWNSFSSNYPGTVRMHINGDLLMIVTNEFGVMTRGGVQLSNSVALNPVPTNIINWSAYDVARPARSLVVPLGVGNYYLPTSVYEYPANFKTRLTDKFDSRTDFQQPRWGVTARLRLRFYMVDVGAGRIIDYVQIDESNRGFEIAEAIRDADKKQGLDGIWSTNLLGSGVPQGILNQVLVSLGTEPVGDEWKNFGKWGTDGKGIKDLEIAKFLDFMFPTQTTNGAVQMQVPFTPTKLVAHRTSLQVNDPMVHSLASDLRDIDGIGTNAIVNIPLSATAISVKVLGNIGVINERYAPWGTSGGYAGEENKGFADLHDVALKDPGVVASSSWDFPTNNFYPQVGWMGRVHRGTPWQTVYLKANDFPAAELRRKWQRWAGNEFEADARLTKPVNDRILFDLFTATVDERVTRGLLPVNQTNLAAWSAVFGGVIALSNSVSAAAPVSYVIEPVSVAGPSGAMAKIFSGITRTRADTNLFSKASFRTLGDVLAAPELTDKSPFVTQNRTGSSTEAENFRNTMTDPLYEWLPQQVMGLLRFSEPRFVLYTYGQSLKPAPGALLTGGGLFGLCTNYQVTAEIGTKSVLRVVNPNSDNPTIEQESFNILPPD